MLSSLVPDNQLCRFPAHSWQGSRRVCSRHTGIDNFQKGKAMKVHAARFTFSGYATYAAAKGAIEVLTRYLAKELGSRGITVNVIAPGAIETDFGGGIVREDRELNQRIAGMTALGRAGVADDIGPMIAAFLSDENRWVNGQRIEVSGA